MENKDLWFRAKNFGWGWYLISWQGWVITLLYVLALVPDAIRVNAEQTSVSDFLINFGFHFILLTFFFLIICYTKGERPEWRWGTKKKQ